MKQTKITSPRRALARSLIGEKHPLYPLSIFHKAGHLSQLSLSLDPDSI